jgi:hypothetical protein
MSAVISTAAFGNADAIRAAEVGNAAYERAVKLGYARLAALQFSRMAKKVVRAGESPQAVAKRVVQPKTMSAMRTPPTGGQAA